MARMVFLRQPRVGGTGETKALLMPDSAFTGLSETHFHAFVTFAAKPQRGESPELSGQNSQPEG